MYYVKDDSKLNSFEGYEIYTAGAASSVPWEGIMGKPSNFNPISHTHAVSDITSGTLPITRGGTGVTSNPSLLVNLASNTADTVFETSPRPGVTGVLSAANGGTGKTSLSESTNALINSLNTESKAPVDNDYVVIQSSNGGTTNTNYYRKSISYIYDYLKPKTDSLYLGKTATATAANKLATSRTITLTGAVTGSGEFDGSDNLTINATVNHNYAGSSSKGGAATSANKLNTDAGSATNPVYFANGIPVKCTYELNKTVPSDAVFTDTHYTTGVKVGASGTNSNAAVTNPYVKVLDNTTYRSQIQLKGGGATTVSSDANGVVTITSTNTTYSAGNGLTLSSNTFNVGAGTGIEVAADAISVKYGTSAGTAAQGNDSRLSDARNPKINSLSNEDLNNITTPGFYAGGGSNTVTNKPSGIDAFGLIVFRTAGGYITQELIEGNTNAGCRWTRQYTGSWGSWIPMPTFGATPTSGQVLVTDGTTGKVKSSGYTIAKSVPSDAKFTDTTYSSKSAASGGTDVSLVTTGEKATWNAKASTAVATTSANGLMSKDDKSKLDGIATGATANKGTVTKITAGTGLTGGDITSSGTIALATSGVTAGTYGDDESTRTLTHSDVFDVPQITVDSYGRVTSATTKTLTLPASGNTDTYTSAYCNTAAGTAAKTATCTGYSLLAKSYLHITMVNSNSSAGALTLNVNGKGAKPVYINGSASSSSNYNLPAGTYIVYYDGSNYYFRTDGAITGKTTSVPNHSADYIIGGYLNIHPENSPTLIPMINNDIAHLLKRGGSAVVTYDGTTKSVDLTNVFDGSPSYCSLKPTGITTMVIELTLHKAFGWSNYIYVDFGSTNWRAKSIKVEVMNTNYANDTWTQKGSTTTNGSGHYAISVSHTPSGASNAGGGFNKLRFTFSSWQSSSDFRIAALGIYNYGSSGLRETFVPKDGGELYGSLTPFTNGSYSLGTTAKYWGNAYINKINGVSVGSSPKFTDTDTKVTSVGNHYTPAEDTGAAISAANGSATNITGTSGKLNVITGLKRDAKGHIVGVTSANIYSTDNNT